MNGRDAWGQTVYAWPEDDAIRWWKGKTLDSQPYLVADPNRPPGACRISRAARATIRSTTWRRGGYGPAGGPGHTGPGPGRPDIELNLSRMNVPGLRTSGGGWRRVGCTTSLSPSAGFLRPALKLT